MGQPCQKHPSTKTQTLRLLKTKSGLPSSFWFRRHPTKCWSRKIAASSRSVVLFPLDFIRAITWERLSRVKTSVILSDYPRDSPASEARRGNWDFRPSGSDSTLRLDASHALIALSRAFKLHTSAGKSNFGSTSKTACKSAVEVAGHPIAAKSAPLMMR